MVVGGGPRFAKSAKPFGKLREVCEALCMLKIGAWWCRIADEPLRREAACGHANCWIGGILPVGTWLSLVEHSLGVRGVGSSNLPVPTNHSLSVPAFQKLPDPHP